MFKFPLNTGSDSKSLIDKNVEIYTFKISLCTLHKITEMTKQQDF